MAKVQKAERKFFKKVKKTRLFGAAISLLLTLILSYLLYAMEFTYSANKQDLANAITDFLAPSGEEIDASVLEIKEMDGTLFVSFKDENNATINGIAKFIKGWNNKYRIIQTTTESSKYSSVIQCYPMKNRGDQLIVVSGYNLSDEIKYYGLNYSAYTRPGSLSDDRVTGSLKFEVANLQFLEFYNTEELDRLLVESEDHMLYHYHLTGISFFDKNGNEITKNYKMTDYEMKDVSSSTSKAELFLLYVFIAIVLGVGIIMMRYFLVK